VFTVGLLTVAAPTAVDGLTVDGPVTVAVAAAPVTVAAPAPAPAPDAVAGDVRIHAVTLGPGFTDPAGGQVDGARLDVPNRPATVLLTAEAGAEYALRFRTGSTWGPWTELGAETGEGPDALGGGDLAVGPVRVADGADALDVVLVGGADTDIEVTFLLDPTGDGAPGGGPEVAGTQQVRSGERPTIVDRSSWATAGWATGNNGCANGPHYADNLQAVVIHHTVTTNDYSRDEVDDLLRAIYYGHVVVNGWCDIGYNFVVDRFGTIWEGRSGGTDRPVIGGHAKGFNTSTVGVALLGQHHPGASPRAARPTSSAEAAIEALAAWKLGRYGVDPAGTTWLKNRSSRGAQRLTSGQWHLIPTVLAHRDIGTTSCPGNYGVEVKDRVSAALTAHHPGSLPLRFEAWTPAPVGEGFVTLDGRGGIRPAGSAVVPGIGAPPLDSGGPAPLPSPQPLAVAARRSGSTVEGYVLHGDGMVHPFGGSPGVADPPAGPARAVDLALAETGGWVVAANGTVNGFGGSTDLSVGRRTSRPVVAAAITEAGLGYLLTDDGQLLPVGGAPAADQGTSPNQPVDVALAPSGTEGWVLAADGSLHPFGGAPDVEVTSPRRPSRARRFISVVAAPSGNGGWVVTDDGQLWPFGTERLVVGAPTDTTSGGIVDATTVAPVASAEFLSGPTGRYIGAAVELFLDRPAGPADYATWEGRFTFHGGRRAVTGGLARSEEWAGRRIDDLYRDALGRPADDRGRRYWLEEMETGLALHDVGTYFYGSAEYVAASGSSPAYVDRLYHALLDRPPDGDGHAYWVDRLESGTITPPEIAAAFSSSIESRRDRVVGLYRDVLDRDPDPNGLGYWAQRLLEIDDVVLAAELAASDEFHTSAVG